ncbi:uncharacterized protein [Rutidosis leptorrhynchoides]|uniref:uncharacterized protein n=1 Tax=Rutidosis leptorrhynchoides TaxID=125765 RepID=UPI003A9A0D3A
MKKADETGQDGIKFIPFTDLVTSQIAEGAIAGRGFNYSEAKKFGEGDELKNKYRNLDLKDLDAVVLPCTWWGQFMVNFLDYMNKASDKQCVILVIQFSRTKKFR